MLKKSEKCDTEFWSDFGKNNFLALMEPLVIKEDHLEAVMPKFTDIPSVKLINDIFNIACASFYFKYVSLDETSREIDKINPKKSNQATNVPRLC